ncbi:MAG: hypothetical protein ACI9C4_001619 [Paraglaciecola sp.]
MGGRATVTALGAFTENTGNIVAHERDIILSSIGASYGEAFIADAYNSIVYGNNI